MGLEKLSRRKITSGVYYYDSKIKECVTGWLQFEGWKPKHFGKFLELVGMSLPVELSDFNNDQRSFICKTADGKEHKIQLIRGNRFDSSSEIYVDESNEHREYIVYSYYNGNTVPVELQGKDSFKPGKKLECFYSRFFCDRTLEFDEDHVLKITLMEPEASLKKEDVKVLRNKQPIEEYLLGLETDLSVDDVYNKMVNLIGYTEKELKDTTMISISYKNGRQTITKN